MADTDVFINSWGPFPDYALSSTGSLRLTGLPRRCPSTLVGFEEVHRKQAPETSLRQRMVRGANKAWSQLSWRRAVKSHLPFVKTLRHYRVSRDLLSDVLAGVTVGVMMIPQGMAFALVASLPPIVGLYMALFSSLVYVFLGTAHHLSWNCVAVLAIMMGNLLDTYEAQLRHTLPRDLLLPNGTPTPLTDHHHTIFGQGNATAASMLSESLISSEVQNVLVTDPKVEAGSEAVYDVLSAVPPSLGSADNDSAAGVTATSAPPGVSQLEKVIASKKMELACSVTLLSGVILAVLGKLGLGRLASFMSDSLVISFTVGVTFHVFVGQLGNALGLELAPHNGVFKIFTQVADIASNLKHTNITTTIIFASCAITIYTVKRFVNEKYADKLKVPVPVELIVVIVATVVNANLKLNETNRVSIVEEISVGIPRPKVPDVKVGLNYLSEGLIIIFVSFTQTVALGKIMALKHNYRIDCNLEMFSLGVASVVCSFFSGFIPGASITCSVIQDSAGGKTQIASVFSAGLVLFVVMFLGPYFYYLPRCVLAAIVMVNIRAMLLKLLTVTCLATVVLDTDLGLLVGMAVCMSGVLVRSRISPVRVLGQVTVDKTHLWRSVDKYHDAQELPKVKVVGINSDFYFVNAELITDEIVKLSGINPSKLKRKGNVLHVEAPGKTAKTQNGHIVIKIHQNDDTEKPPAPDDASKLLNAVNASDHSTVLPTEQTPAHDHSTPDHHQQQHTHENGVIHENETRENGHLLPPVSDIIINNTKNSNNHTTNENSHMIPQEHHHHQQAPQLPITALIIDFSCVSYIDLMAVGALDILVADYEAVGVKVFLTQLHERCVSKLRATGFLDKHCDKVFLTNSSALNYS
ncbi:prestin-like [Babylonia areolata]|uniref:prestin-like n=1 Tax=Babylonia areolata TaxID=304850 RepID=UPI003FCFB37D